MQRFFHEDSKMMKLMTWLADVAHIQILWVVFTFGGLIFGGFFPATVAMFALLRKIIQSGNTFHFNKEFWTQFKYNFIKANLLGYSIVAVSILLGLHYNYSLNIAGAFSLLFSLSSLAIGLILLLVVLYVAPIYVHFDITNIQIIKHAFIMVISTPFHALGMVALGFLFFWSASTLPVLVPFVSIGILAYGIMRIADHAFNIVDKVSEKNKKTLTT